MNLLFTFYRLFLSSFVCPFCDFWIVATVAVQPVRSRQDYPLTIYELRKITLFSRSIRLETLRVDFTFESSTNVKWNSPDEIQTSYSLLL